MNFFNNNNARTPSPRPARSAADPAWMQGIDKPAPETKEGGDEGWLISSWELKRGLRVRESAPEAHGAHEPNGALWPLWLEAERASKAQAAASTSRCSAAPSSITASA